MNEADARVDASVREGSQEMSVTGERRYQAVGGRWGPGKVHRYIYDRLNKLWHPACRQPGDYYHGEEVDPATSVTCRKVGCR